MADVSRDLGTELDWVAVDHWNTDNPHIHILMRGRAADGADLVIDRDYIREGMRSRAEQRVTLELGPRSEREIQASLAREVTADRWTSLDRRLQRQAEETGGVIDLRPVPSERDSEVNRLLRGRAAQLERLGLADQFGPASWTLKPGLENTLRELAVRNDIIKTMHQAMSAAGRAPNPMAFAIHHDAPSDPVIGRLTGRGLHDELTGQAYAVVDGLDGRTHHLRFDDIAMTGDAKPGAIVELRSWQDPKGRERHSLATRSDLSLEQQVTARGATWIDRQLVAHEPLATGGGFGAEVRDVMAKRIDHLAAQGLASRQGRTVSFAQDLVDTLSRREVADAARTIAQRTGLSPRTPVAGAPVAGTYRERVTLASGRFAMIDDGFGFQLVPWRPALEQHLGRQVVGTLTPGGGINWTLGRHRGPSI